MCSAALAQPLNSVEAGPTISQTKKWQGDIVSLPSKLNAYFFGNYSRIKCDVNHVLILCKISPSNTLSVSIPTILDATWNISKSQCSLSYISLSKGILDVYAVLARLVGGFSALQDRTGQDRTGCSP